MALEVVCYTPAMLVKFTVPGPLSSGNLSVRHTRNGGHYRSQEARYFHERVASIAKAAAVLAGYTMPTWVAMDVTVYNSRLDRDNANKVAADALQGILFPYDSRVIDGTITKRWDDGGERLEIAVRPVDPHYYGRKNNRLKV